MRAVTSVAKGLATALLVVFAMRVTDLYARDVVVWRLDGVHVLLFIELFVTILLPAALLGLFPEVRASRGGLVACAGLTAFGVVLNRFDVSLTAFAVHREHVYFPSVVELAVSAGLIALGVLVFDLAARRLPVYAPALADAKAGPGAS